MKIAFMIILKRDGTSPTEVYPFAMDEWPDCLRLYDHFKINWTELYLVTVSQGPPDSSIVVCPGCRIELTVTNAGGYRTFCESCVAAFPPLPTAGAWTIEGTFPRFKWIEAVEGGTRSTPEPVPDPDMPF
jgi:hypothetical protein